MNNYDYYKNMIEENLADKLPSVAPQVQVLWDSMNYSVKSGGKRLRPVLLLACADFAGGNPEEALPFACAIEYIHTYSLIHDDLPAMDDDDLRRGNPTNHKVYGEAMAILAGDGLLNTAYEIMLQDAAGLKEDSEKLHRHVMAVLEVSRNAGIHGMIAGQVADMENEGKECSEEMLNFIDSNKTGALLKAPILAGLYIGNAPEAVRTDFEQYAELVGRAFQISDDILDVIGDEKVMGKKLGKDADHGKCNYATVLGLEAAKDELHSLTEKAVALMEKYGDSAEFFIELAHKLERRKS